MNIIDYIQAHSWLILFLIWGFPLSFYRSKFRKLVYNTTDWKINIKPVFGKEIKVLFGISEVSSDVIKKNRNFYRVYLIIYILLFIIYKITS
jgi:peroxiredoxin Q/BCP